MISATGGKRRRVPRPLGVTAAPARCAAACGSTRPRERPPPSGSPRTWRRQGTAWRQGAGGSGRGQRWCCEDQFQRGSPLAGSAGVRAAAAAGSSNAGGTGQTQPPAGCVFANPPKWSQRHPAAAGKGCRGRTCAVAGVSHAVRHDVHVAAHTQPAGAAAAAAAAHRPSSLTCGPRRSGRHVLHHSRPSPSPQMRRLQSPVGRRGGGGGGGAGSLKRREQAHPGWHPPRERPCPCPCPCLLPTTHHEVDVRFVRRGIHQRHQFGQQDGGLQQRRGAVGRVGAAAR